ncbi:related to RNA polymerase II mediator complex protein pmc1 [Rhynchosporium agropyri]|uniref:Mediator of RNA polymerase II transcription subunit 14 n=1 Tax=Rhynchosporium agropyri TaxID=914238 RepID=A0A1E1L476_9HELO|nr:related to RNA polymerase II mediator complex protein pmc1 [Rhynchosporium agropyri]
MDHRSSNGSHTNHDRHQRPNGSNEAMEKMQEKGKAREPYHSTAQPGSTMLNGLNGKMPEYLRHGDAKIDHSQNLKAHMNRLPEEIAHIAENYFPLSTLISRLAQKTHVDVLNTIQELGQMPAPVSAVNGNASYHGSVEDSSTENVSKKLRLLNFATSSHEAWTKALVITGWSRKAEEVTHLIDVRIHLEAQKQLYTQAIDLMAENKRALHNFRLPNPDLKTALEVLTTGKASWMPDLNYIQPPPLTAKEVLRSLEKLNTLLSIRLNLNDYESIPWQFKDFTIKSGRATFTVPGEFEIDLTIADEDPESQYWYIDFRFCFQPSSASMSPGIRWHLENKVNEILLRDGLSGCYKYLHELILTYKINEFRRQAVTLARSTWIDTLRVEILNRPISIQYWLNRYSDHRNPKGVLTKGTKSWIILGVHSGRRKDGRQDPKATSRLFIRWFRESKEVKDVDIPFDVTNISAESLLKSIVAKHIDYILTSIYTNLVVKPLFAKRELELSLKISHDNPTTSELRIQLTNEQHVTIRIDPISGRFVFGPMGRTFATFEAGLNDRIRDPANEGHTWIERLRMFLITEDLTTRALSVGWNKIGNPELRYDKVQQFAGKNHLGVVWFRRNGWLKDWYLAVSQSMSGETWYLVKTFVPAPKIYVSQAYPHSALVPTSIEPKNREVACAVKLPIKAHSPKPTYSFLSTLNIFAAGVASHYSNMKTLHAKHVHHMLGKGRASKGLTLPSIFAKFSELIPSKNRLPRTGKPWAKDIIRISFQGVEMAQQDSLDIANLDSPEKTPGYPSPNMPPASEYSVAERSVLITEAHMLVPLPQALLNINEQVDKDIVFNAQNGTFAIRLHSRVGESVIPALVERLVRVERLVEFVQVLDRYEKSLTCETVSLGRIVFTYRNNPAHDSIDAADIGFMSDLYRATIDFSAADNVMALLLERGNPHLRISDILSRILNGSEGLDGIATFLPLTLPVLRGFDAIEKAWDSDDLSGLGEVFINVRASDSYLIRYILMDPSPTAKAHSMSRKVTLEVKLRQRKGVPWWYVRRSDDPARNKGEDALDQDFKILWKSSGPGWQGMSVSGVAQGAGAEILLVKIDEVVRAFALSGKSLDSIAQAPIPGPQKQAPVLNGRQQQQQQQRQQQPFPNMNQNQIQTQGRNNALKREVVEID